jgi:translocation and assembly module TamA
MDGSGGLTVGASAGATAKKVELGQDSIIVNTPRRHVRPLFGFRWHSRLAAVAGLLCLAQLAAMPASAFELFGVQLFGAAEQDDGEDVLGTPVPYDIEAEIAPTGGDLLGEDALIRASALWRGRDEPALGAAGLLADARGDYRRLLGALYAQGHYGGTISVTVNGQEASSIPPDADLSAPVNVLIAIDPGPLYRFGTLEFVDAAPPATDLRDEVPTLRELGFLPGEPARSGVILRAEQTAVTAWRQQGYALAQSAGRSVEADHRTRTVDVTITLDPEGRATYGALAVEGAERMAPDFIAYMADLPPGQEYDPDDIDAANARLAALEVFRSVRIEQAETLMADGSLPQTIYVQEMPLRRIGAGGSISSVDGLGLEAYWLHRNLFGRAERLRLDGRVSGITSAAPEDFTYRFNATFTRPGIITPDTRLIASLSAEREVLDAYTRTGASGELGLEHPFSPELTGRFAVAGRQAQFEDAVFGTRNFTSAGFEARLTYDSRDMPANATSGIYLEAGVEPFYEFTRGETGVVVSGEARAYQSLSADDRLVLAGRVRAASLFGPSIADTAPDRLFLAGGGGSVRGYAYRNIGVTQPGGQITAGRFLLEGSAELRARITDTLGAVVFADAGYVDADGIPDFDEDIRVGAGAGLRYITPLGPIRLDVAVPLDPRPDDPDFAVYLGIGQSF